MATPGSHGTYVQGIALLMAVVLLWTLSSFIMNSLFTTQSYNKPFLTTYLCTASFALYLIPPGISYFIRRRQHHHYTSLPSQPGGISPGAQPGSQDSSGTGTGLAPLSTKETLDLAGAFCIIWFLANWAVNAALGMTSVSSATILSSCSAFFTLLMGSLAGVESYHMGKLVAVTASVVGVALVSTTDHKFNSPSLSSAPSLSDPTTSQDGSPIPPGANVPTHPLLGDLLALISAVCYALYVTLLKARIRDESRVKMTLLFGFVGAINIIFLWPIGLILHVIGWETFEWPDNGQIWGSLGISALITFTSDVLWSLGMLRTTPLAATLALSLTIPVALAGDVFKGTALGIGAFVGGALVVGAFVAVGWAESREKLREGGFGSGQPLRLGDEPSRRQGRRTGWGS